MRIAAELGTKTTVHVSAVVAIAVGVAAAAGGTSRCSIHYLVRIPNAALLTPPPSPTFLFIMENFYLIISLPAAALVPPLSTDNIPSIHMHIDIDIDAAFSGYCGEFLLSFIWSTYSGTQ